MPRALPPVYRGNDALGRGAKDGRSWTLGADLDRLRCGSALTHCMIVGARGHGAYLREVPHRLTLAKEAQALMRELLESFVPNAAGSLWFGIVIAFWICGDSRALLARRNVELVGLLVLAPALLHILDFGQVGRATAAPLFSVIFLCTAGYAAWSYILSRSRTATDWLPNLPRRALQAVLALVLALDVAVVLGRAPDDAGIYSNLGAQRWAETGTIPYADGKLKGPNAPAFGAAATYGPLLLAAHLPFQYALGVKANPPDASPTDPAYRWPSQLATQLACLSFFAAALVGLYLIVRREAGEQLGLCAVILFAASPYVQGLGGEKFFIGGLAYISHIAPTAMLLLAFAALRRPFLSGLLLACAAGVLFWPAFLFPLWFGWRFWRRDGTMAFTAGFLIAGALLAAIVVYYTHAPVADSVRLFLDSTLEHQEGVGPKAYGASTMSFWGTHPRLASVLQQPLIGTTSLVKPMFVAFSALCVAAAFWARGRSTTQFAALTAMLGSGIQLWKTHATGSYVEWYLPFLIIALIGIGSTHPPRTTHDSAQAK